MSSLRTYNDLPVESYAVPIENFFEILDQHRNNPAPFLSYFDRSILKKQYSFAEFVSAVDGMTRAITLNLKNDHKKYIAVAMENSSEALLVYSSVLNSGYSLLPLDPFQTAEYYENISKIFSCEYVIAKQGSVSLEAFSVGISYESLSLQQIANVEIDTPKPQTATVIFFSSGTTGRPKGIEQNFKSLVMNSLATIKTHALNTKSKHFCILPVFHVNAFSFSYLTSLIVGHELILNTGFSLNDFWKVMNQTQPQIASVIPPILRLLVEDPRSHEIPKSVKYFVSAASHLPKKTLLEFYSKFQIPVIQAYGLSETVNFSTTFPTNLSRDSYLQVLASDNKVSIGVEVWGNNLFILDDNNQVISEENKIGEIVVRGWNLMNGYLDDSRSTESAFKNDYFYTGDIGYFKLIQNQKFYFLNGRKKEIAKVNGKLIYLNELDEMLLSLSYVLSACCVSYFDLHQEEQLGLYVQTTGVQSPESILYDVHEMTKGQVKIKKIIFGNEILMTPSGKKRRAEMARLHFNETKVYDN